MASNCSVVGSNSDVIEAFLTSRKRRLLHRALTHFSNSIRKNPTRYMKSFGLKSTKTVTSHINSIDEMFDDFNIR